MGPRFSTTLSFVQESWGVLLLRWLQNWATARQKAIIVIPDGPQSLGRKMVHELGQSCGPQRLSKWTQGLLCIAGFLNSATARQKPTVILNGLESLGQKMVDGFRPSCVLRTWQCCVLLVVFMACWAERWNGEVSCCPVQLAAWSV